MKGIIAPPPNRRYFVPPRVPRRHQAARWPSAHTPTRVQDRLLRTTSARERDRSAWSDTPETGGVIQCRCLSPPRSFAARAPDRHHRRRDERSSGAACRTSRCSASRTRSSCCIRRSSATNGAPDRAGWRCSSHRRTEDRGVRTPGGARERLPTSSLRARSTARARVSPQALASLPLSIFFHNPTRASVGRCPCTVSVTSGDACSAGKSPAAWENEAPLQQLASSLPAAGCVMAGGKQSRNSPFWCCRPLKLPHPPLKSR